MKKKKFITPKMRVIKLEAEELMAASTPEQQNKGVGLANGTYTNVGNEYLEDIE